MEEDRDLAMPSHSSFEMPDLDKKRDMGLGDADIEASRITNPREGVTPGVKKKSLVSAAPEPGIIVGILCWDELS
jgi:hypothetical protein